MIIEVYLSDYREKENPASKTLVFIGNNIAKAFDTIEKEILPRVKYGMDVYIRNTDHPAIVYGYYRDLAKYPRKGQELIIKTGATGLWYVK